MSVAGDTQTRFGRSYIFVNPDPSVSFLEGRQRSTAAGTIGTWRLAIDDEYVPDGGGGGGGGGSGTVKDATVALDSPAVAIGNLLYMKDNGAVGLAKADSIDTSVVVGAATTAAAPGGTVTFAANAIIDIFNTGAVIDNDISLLARGFAYYLSAENPGNWTLTPDTTTEGAVVIQCGLAVDTNQMLIEIQTPTEA